MKKLLIIISIFALSSCASPTVVDVMMPGDASLSCGQLQNAYTETKRYKREADGEKGVTGGNVARLLFWPSIIGTYLNANEAIQAADSRMVHLANVMRSKDCEIPK